MFEFEKMSYASAAGGAGSGGAADVDMSNMPRSAEEQRQRQEAAAQREEQIEQMLRQICSPAALDRLKRVQLVREDRANQVKMMLIQMAQVRLASRVCPTDPRPATQKSLSHLEIARANQRKGI